MLMPNLKWMNVIGLEKKNYRTPVALNLWLELQSNYQMQCNLCILNVTL